MIDWYLVLGIVLLINLLGVILSILVFFLLRPKLKILLRNAESRIVNSTAQRISDIWTNKVQRVSETEVNIAQSLSDTETKPEQQGAGLKYIMRNEVRSLSSIFKDEVNDLQIKLDQNQTAPLERTSPSFAQSPEIGTKLDRLLNDVDFIKNHQSSYLGQGIALTHLIDETPIYINSNDFGGPANFINGGRYEEEYYQVLASFCFPNAIFLDIGANLGVFTLRLAPLLRCGSIHAFEPNPKIRQLLEKSLHLNGLSSSVNLHGFGLSDVSAQLAFFVPDGHAGGGSIELAKADGARTQTIQAHRFDDQFPKLTFDIAKIDVEGHELSVFKGMRRAIQRSINCILMFEKLNAFSGIESDVWEFFVELGLRIYRVDGANLVAINLQQFKEAEAYFIAARYATIAGQTERSFLNIYPGNLFGANDKVKDDRLIFDADAPAGSLFFHGPYWYLPKGSYRVDLLGEVAGSFELVLTEKYGFKVNQVTVSTGQQSVYWVVERDLHHFELVGRSSGVACSVNIERLNLTRLG
jgi:FkbM family methyltransferase